MKVFLRITVLAWRNTLRNSRRSLMTALVITLGIMFLFTIRGFLNGLQKEIIENISKGELGEIQITRTGFREALPARSLEFLFKYSNEIKEIILKQKHVTGVTSRLQFGGMINHQNSQTTTPFIAIGINPESENKVCPRLKDMVKKNTGEFLISKNEMNIELAKSNLSQIPDANLDAEIDFSKPVPTANKKNLKTKNKEEHQVLIGTSMRKGFGYEKNGFRKEAQVNDEVILLTQGVDEIQHSISGKITGVFETPNPSASKMMTYIVLKTAQKLLNAPNQVTQLVLSLDDTKYRKQVADTLTQKLKAFDLIAQPWDEVNDFFAMIITLEDTVFSVVVLIIILFVIIAIIITSMMTVTERTREIGTLMAIGYTRKTILRLFVLESGFIGFFGGIGGLIIGSLVVFILSSIGIPFFVPGTESAIIIKPFNGIVFVFITLLLGLIAGIIGAYFPARKASHMSPMEAMVHV